MATFKELGKLGRTGNQLFQISTTVAHSLKMNEPYYFPYLKYNPFFNLKDCFIKNPSFSETYNEPCFAYREIPAKKNLNLLGYFQSYKYFSDFEDEIRKLFYLPHESKASFNNCAAIHVRRGDYLIPAHRGCYEILGMDYYEKAMAKITADKYYVFSDDINWCKQHFKGNQFIFVYNNEIDDLKMMMNCQPKGTLIRTYNGEVPIEKIKENMRVFSYNNTRCIQVLIGLSKLVTGRKVLNINKKHFNGDLICVSAGNKKTQYTPDHHCMVRMGDAFKNKYILYLMKKGRQYRVGITSPAKHGRNRQVNIVGYADPRLRLTQEQGEQLWVLKTFDDAVSASMHEHFVSYKFGLPQIGFKDTKGSKIIYSAFWEMFGENEKGAIECLNFFNKDINFPFYFGGSNNVYVGDKEITLMACNLFDGMKMLDADLYTEKGGKGRVDSAWVKISVSRLPFSGAVYSLNVDKNHYYVGDGIVTHNCNSFIIANSSYSWWGAWLSDWEDKKVIAPQKWFGPKLAPTHPTNDLIPPDWERI